MADADFLKNSNDLPQWQSAAEHLDGIAAEAVAKAQHSPDAMDGLRDTLSQISSNWEANRILYTYAQMDADNLVALASASHVAWQTIFNAKACFGPVEDLQKIYQAGVELDKTFNLNDALQWSSRSVSFCPGLKSTGCYETTEQLLQWGANPASYFDYYNSKDAGSYFYRAVEECGVEFGKLYARHGLPLNMLNSSMNNAQSNNKTKLYRALREIYWEYGRYTVPDAETLVEKKEIDASQKIQFRIIFNFASARVSEILEWEANAQRPPVISNFTFDEYSPVAIDAARKKLIELGGSPAEAEKRLEGKKPVAYPLKKGLSKTPTP